MNDNRDSIAKTNSGTSRFYDKAGNTLNLSTVNEEAMTVEQKAYVSLQKIYSSRSTQVTVSGSTVKFDLISFATLPTGFPEPNKEVFQVFINGLIVESEAVLSVVDTGSGVLITLEVVQLGFEISSTDEYTVIGKFN